MTTAEKLVQIANNIDAVYNAGVAAGKAEAKKSAYDTFWEEYQRGGTRTAYQGAFAGIGWTENTFKPKYDIAPTASRNMFYMANGLKSIASCGVNFDFSNCTEFYSTFMSAVNLNVDIDVDCSSATDLQNTFAYNGAIKVKKLIVHENLNYTNTFTSNPILTEISFEGVIGKSINFGACSKLNLASALSIVNHLKNLTGTGTTATLTLHANVWALLDADTSFPEHIPAEEGATASWKTYITDVLGWGRA